MYTTWTLNMSIVGDVILTSLSLYDLFSAFHTIVKCQTKRVAVVNGANKKKYTSNVYADNYTFFLALKSKDSE